MSWEVLIGARIRRGVEVVAPNHPIQPLLVLRIRPEDPRARICKESEGDGSSVVICE